MLHSLRKNEKKQAIYEEISTEAQKQGLPSFKKEIADTHFAGLMITHRLYKTLEEKHALENDWF